MEWLLAPVVLAGLVVIALGGGEPENRNPVPDGGEGTPHLPAACVVTAGRAYRFPTVARPTAARNRLIGRILLVIAAGVCLLFLVAIALVLKVGG